MPTKIKAKASRPIKAKVPIGAKVPTGKAVAKSPSPPKIKATGRSLPGTYFDLVRRFPLTHILDDDHLAEASEVIDDLLRQDLDEGGREYLDVLTDLVEGYEDETVEIPDASEADVLRELMRANGLSQPRLAREVGIVQSTLSAVLNGSRSLTKEQVVKLARRFGVSPAAFLPA